MKIFTYANNALNRRLNRVGMPYSRSYLYQQLGGLGGAVESPPPEIQNMIQSILPNLSESTQNVIRFLNIKLKNAPNQGSRAAAYETLGSRWMQYALFTQDPVKKGMATAIANFYLDLSKRI
jgi:hypothetical protein